MTNKIDKNFDVTIAVRLMLKEEQRQKEIRAHNNKIITFKASQGVDNA